MIIDITGYGMAPALKAELESRFECQNRISWDAPGNRWCVEIVAASADVAREVLALCKSVEGVVNDVEIRDYNLPSEY